MCYSLLYFYMCSLALAICFILIVPFSMLAQNKQLKSVAFRENSFVISIYVTNCIQWMFAEYVQELIFAENDDLNYYDWYVTLYLLLHLLMQYLLLHYWYVVVTIASFIVIKLIFHSCTFSDYFSCTMPPFASNVRCCNRVTCMINPLTTLIREGTGKIN